MGMTFCQHVIMISVADYIIYHVGNFTTVAIVRTTLLVVTTIHTLTRRIQMTPQVHGMSMTRQTHQPASRLAIPTIWHAKLPMVVAIVYMMD